MRPHAWSFAPILVLALAAAPAAETTYEPTWESLDSRPTPQWFRDARFGIFIHWGVYSVPAWAPKGKYAEWYWRHMHNKKDPTWKHHVETYGADFDYRQFAPRFQAEKFEPDQWADLFKRAGARYVVITSKHHDGFCLWPAPDAEGWNAADVGPKRDLLGDLTKAVREAGLRMGFYYSLYEWYHPLYRKDVDRYVETHMLPQFRDLVSRYAPAVVWPDGEWDHPADTWHSREFLAWLLNESPCREYVAVNDRWGKGCRGRHGGFYTSEYGGHGGKVGAEHLWEECQGIGRSFGYNRNEGPEDYRTPTQLIRLLVDCVSRGGNLLLDIGPKADGTIPQIMQDRLLAMGRWLETNGESIYGAGAGPVAKLPWGRCTAKPGKLFLHVYDWPEGDLEIPGLQARIECAYLLADPDRTWLLIGQSPDGWPTVTVPREAPDPHDSVVVLELEGEARVAAGRPVAQKADGSVLLHARDATIHGATARYEEGGGKDNIGFWTNPNDWVSWKLELKKPGTFDVAVTFACDRGSGGSEYQVAVGDQKLRGTVEETGGWANFTTKTLGSIELPKPGEYTLAVKPIKKPATAVMNLRAVALTPASK